MIPKNIIHLVPTVEGVGPDQRRNLDAIAAQNPGWNQIVFTDQEALEFVRKHYTQRHLDALDRIDPAYGPARSDLLRYLVLDKLGGVYLDNKSGMAKPLDEILRPDDEFVLAQWDNGVDAVDENCGFHPELREVDGGEYINWVIISRAGHPFLAAVIERVLSNIETYSAEAFGVGKNGTLRTTGPIAMTLAIHPILENHPHRRVRSVPAGLLYAASGNGSTHTLSHKLHYSRLVHPVVRLRQDAPLTRRMGAQIKRLLLLGVAWLRHQNRRRRYRSRLKRGKSL